VVAGVGAVGLVATGNPLAAAALVSEAAKKYGPPLIGLAASITKEVVPKLWGWLIEETPKAVLDSIVARQMDAHVFKNLNPVPTTT
jgi:hypothetical protein